MFTELVSVGPGLDWQAWFTVGVIVAIVLALVKEMARPDVIFLGALGLLLVTGLVTPEAAFHGFASPIVLTIGALYVVAAGVQRTQALGFLDGVLLPKTRHLPRVLLRIMPLTSLLSAFMNNTPIVAMLMPRVQQWAARNNLPASKVLLPLSYAAILGGLTTLIGASTNIVVSGLLKSAGYGGLGMFDLTWVGVPVALIVLTYFVLIGHRTLPDRSKQKQPFEDGLRDCLFELRVEHRTPLIGKTVEESGLRALGDAYLAHLRRGDLVVQASPREILRGGDVLVFTGQARALDRLLEYPGLCRVVPSVAEDDYETLPLYEAVVAPSSTLVGQTLRETHFREHYGGVVLAIQRQDERLDGSLGRTPIKAGDLLLIEAWNGFDKRWNEHREEFYLVAARREEQKKPLKRKAPLALLILTAMIAAFVTGIVPLVTAAFTAALAMIGLRCLQVAEARKAVDVSVLIVIAAALGIGHAAEATGWLPAWRPCCSGLPKGFRSTSC